MSEQDLHQSAVKHTLYKDVMRKIIYIHHTYSVTCKNTYILGVRVFYFVEDIHNYNYIYIRI